MTKPEVLTIIESLKDAVPGTASDDGKVLTWDQASGKFVLKFKTSGGTGVLSTVTDIAPPIASPLTFSYILTSVI